MCLSVVQTSFLPGHPDPKERIGYKAFDGTPGDYWFQFKTLNGSVRVLQEHWLRSESRERAYSSCGTPYNVGFHICATRRGAENIGGEIVKVRFKDVTHIGYEWWGSRKIKVYVARQMFVPLEKSNETSK